MMQSESPQGTEHTDSDAVDFLMCHLEGATKEEVRLRLPQMLLYCRYGHCFCFLFLVTVMLLCNSQFPEMHSRLKSTNP